MALVLGSEIQLHCPIDSEVSQDGPRWFAVPEQAFDRLLTTKTRGGETMCRIIVETAGPATLFALRGDAVAC